MQRRNIVVHALPGVGKTTYSYKVADDVFTDHNQHSLILTFSALLKTRGRQETTSKPHINVQSFHSAVVVLFGVTCHKNDHFTSFVRTKPAPKPIIDLSKIGLLVIDEAQDMNEDIESLINIIRPHLHPDHTMLKVGDGFQNLFCVLQNSSTKWLDNPVEYFGGEWDQIELRESYRLPPPISQFINQYLTPNAIRMHYPNHWDERIARNWGSGIISHVSTHIHQDPVDFHRFRFYKDPLPDSVIRTTREYIKKYGSSSVLVVVKSCKFGKKHPIGQLINAVPEAKWIILGVEIGEDASVLLNKTIVGTTYKLKGYQADLVIFCGLDSSLERDEPLLAYALALVGISRPKKKLIVLSNAEHELFFTMRATPTNITSFVSSTMNIADMVTYNRFDPEWDVLETKIEEKCVPVLMDTQIQTSRTLCEPVSQYYENAMRKAVIYSLALDTHPEWEVLVNQAIRETTELNHAKRQLPPLSSWVDSEMLDNVLKTTMDLIPESVEFEPRRGVQLKSETKCLQGIIYLVLDNNKLVNVQFTREFGYAQAQEMSLMGEVLGIEDSVSPRDFEMLIVNPVAGERRSVQHKPGLLHAMLKRKRFI